MRKSMDIVSIIVPGAIAILSLWGATVRWDHIALALKGLYW